MSRKHHTPARARLPRWGVALCLLGLGWQAHAGEGPMSAPFNAPLSAPFSAPCSSAKAVHDMRCPNYAGFKPRWGQQSAAPAPAPATPADAPAAAAASGLSAPAGWRLGKALQNGTASWYGPGFHGRRTANGESFDMHELTAAHKTLPFGTRVLVHSPRTGKQVVVRINDRGPFAKNRVIDLSKAAAKALGIKARGHDQVVLHTLVPDSGGARASLK